MLQIVASPKSNLVKSDAIAHEQPEGGIAGRDWELPRGMKIVFSVPCVLRNRNKLSFHWDASDGAWQDQQPIQRACFYLHAISCGFLEASLLASAIAELELLGFDWNFQAICSALQQSLYFVGLSTKGGERDQLMSCRLAWDKLGT